MTPKIIAVDFDGTLCNSKWPDLGVPNIPLIQTLIKLRRSGSYKLILWTCREGVLLENAVEWCKIQGLEFDAVNANLQAAIDRFGNDSRKISADYYIDDKNMGFQNILSNNSIPDNVFELME